MAEKVAQKSALVKEDGVACFFGGDVQVEDFGGALVGDVFVCGVVAGDFIQKTLRIPFLAEESEILRTLVDRGDDKIGFKIPEPGEVLAVDGDSCCSAASSAAEMESVRRG